VSVLNTVYIMLAHEQFVQLPSSKQDITLLGAGSEPPTKFC